MQTLTFEQIGNRLAGRHQAVLSVGRRDKGPLAVPMSYVFSEGRFSMVTSPDSLHGRLMQREGRATLTVQYEYCDGRSVHQWYVHAEGPVLFTEDDPVLVGRAILSKDRGFDNADEWLAARPPTGGSVAVLIPERLSGYEYRDSLDV